MAGARVKWTMADLNRMVKAGTVQSYKVVSGPEPEKPKPKRNKYGAKKVIVDGVTFDSKKEYSRWCELQLLEKAGAISNLRRQVTYELGVCRYVADHVYFCCHAGAEIVEDVKSVATRKLPVYRMKKKLMMERFCLAIHEV